MSSSVNFPQGWSGATLAEINSYQSSSMQPKNYTGTTFELYSVPIFPSGKPEIVKAEDIGSSKQFVRGEDVLVCKINPRINRVWNVPLSQDFEKIASSEWIVVRQKNLNSKLLTWYFRSDDFRTRLCADVTGVGGSLTRAQPKQVAKFSLPIPPLAEQKIIADKLDTLLAQVETTKARLERIPNILKSFRQSVLAAAVSGKLTEEWRGTKAVSFDQPAITIGKERSETPEGWTWEQLVDLAKLESGHTPRKSVPEYWGGDVPWISLQDIRAAHGTVINKTKFMPTMLGIENSSARLLPPGTVCFSRDISVGYTTIMGKEMATTQHFVNWICGDTLNNHYLMYSFMAAKDHLTVSGQGSTVKTLYMPACKQFKIILPPLKEQTEIVRRVEELFAFADTIEQKANAALDRVNNLTQSILAKAFRGELTADWRAANPELITGENSAEALLEKIKAEREAMKPKKKTRRKNVRA